MQTETNASENRIEHLEKDVSQLKLDVTAIRARLDATLPTLATKDEVADIKATLNATLPNMATKADLQTVRTEIETVRTEVHRMGMVITMWNVGTILATAGIVFAILRFFGDGG